MLFLDAVERCLATLQTLGRGRQTIAAYRADLMLYGRHAAGQLRQPLGELLLEECAALGVDGYLRELQEVRRNAPATLARRLASLRALYGATWREAGLQDNPAQAIAYPGGKRRSVPALDLDAARSLVRAAAYQSRTPLRDALMLTLMLGNGLSLAELVRLDSCDVDVARREIVVRGRRGRKRTVPVSHATAILLARHIASQPGGPLWCNRQGRRLSPRGVQYVCQRASRHARVDGHASAQALRATARRLMRRAGASPATLRALLGVESAV